MDVRPQQTWPLTPDFLYPQVKANVNAKNLLSRVSWDTPLGYSAQKNNPSATANADTGIKKYARLPLLTVCAILQTTSGQTTHTQPNKTNWEWMGKLSGQSCGCCTKEFYAFVKHQFASSAPQALAVIQCEVNTFFGQNKNDLILQD